MKGSGPIKLASYPAAIVHLDGDAFFASVEQAMHPAWRGRPLVTGRERGIIACASYEAKALGVRRGVALWEARKMCPELIVVPSDYESYSIYSKRMFEIMRRFTPMVEEYSIDEGFADITGMRRVFRTSYEEIARQMQQTVQSELGLTVSVGLSQTKSLAKLGSDFRKPRGFTAVPGRYIHLLLERIPLKDVWGLGNSAVALLKKYGLRNARDYVQRPEDWIGRRLHKPGRDIWHELRGDVIWPVTTEPRKDYASISKGKTFTRPSADRDFVYAKLVRNVESAFIKLRRHNLRVGELSVSLRQRDYVQHGLRARLSRSTAVTQEVLPLVRQLFDELYRSGVEYRTTMVVLGRLESDADRQFDLFEDPVAIERRERITKTVDDVNRRMGKHKLAVGTALYLEKTPRGERDELPWRKQHQLVGETARKRLAIPRLDISV